MVEAEGAGSLSLREVAKRAAVSPAAVYRHFADKEALLAAVAAAGYAGLNQAFAASLEAAGSDPGTRLEALGVAYMDYALGHSGLYRVMFGTSARPPEGALKEESERAYAALVAAITACGGPDTAPEAISAATMAAWSLVHGYIMLRLDGPLAQLPAEALPDMTAVLRNLLPRL